MGKMQLARNERKSKGKERPGQKVFVFSSFTMLMTLSHGSLPLSLPISVSSRPPFSVHLDNYLCRIPPRLCLHKVALNLKIKNKLSTFVFKCRNPLWREEKKRESERDRHHTVHRRFYGIAHTTCIDINL